MGRRPSERALPRQLSGQLRLGIIKGSGQDVEFRDRSIRPALSLLGGPNNDNPNTFSKLGMCSDISLLSRIYFELQGQEKTPVLAFIIAFLYNFSETKQQEIRQNKHRGKGGILMKRWIPFVVSFLLALAVGCSNESEQPIDEHTPLSSESASEPAALDVSDLHDILTSVDLVAADLTFFHEGTEETFPAENAIRVESYIAALRKFTWESYQPPTEWDSTDDYCYQLTVPSATLTAYQSGYADACPLHVETEEGEGWFILPTVTEPTEQYSWMLYDTIAQWHKEAQTAALYGGEGSPLTAEELDWFESFTEGTETHYDEAWDGFIGGATPISCFFTSQYSDPRDMDAEKFLCYCPDQGVLEAGKAGDEEEFRIVQEKVDWRFGEDNHLASLEEIPVPCHRLPRSYINEILTKYAGITVEEMHTDWLEEALYIPETDCFYTFTSDFGPGMFLPCYGEKSGNIVTLWEAPSVESEASDKLVLQKSGEDWQILSHCAIAAS